MTNENDVERLKAEALDEFMKGRSSKDLRQIAFEIISETFNWLRMKDHLTAQTWRGRIDVDMVAQFIRTIDGDNKMGAAELAEKICDHLTASGRLAGWMPEGAVFDIGDRVFKVRGSCWQGKIVGFYSTKLTPIGYAVESDSEHGSVQIYPEAALALAPLPPAPSARKEG